MAADVTEGPIFKASVPRTLFQVPVAQIGHNEQSPCRFLVGTSLRMASGSLLTRRQHRSEPVTVVLNWTAELKK